MFSKRMVSCFGLCICLSCGARTGLLGPEAASDAGSDSPGGSSQRPQARADKIDLLFVIDDSGSMADKQQILSVAVPDLVHRITNPRCIDERGKPTTVQPRRATDPCARGSVREFNPVQDMHIGAVSSNLGGHGAVSDCGQRDGDGARLIDRGVRGKTYQNRGFLAWDPARRKGPAGETDPEKLKTLVRDLVGGVGELGCGLEAPLEAWYRFLVEPAPYQRLELEPCAPGISDSCAVPKGVDEVLLGQRREFLRPDSLVVVVLLSDENDCSIVDGGQAHRLADGTPMPRATSQCRTDPQHPCCRSCADTGLPSCPSTASDPECQKGAYTAQEDGYYMRCFDQKRRFGIDALYPTQRYIDGLTSPRILSSSGAWTNNPLLISANGVERSPSLVFFAGIIGVPWQDIAQNPRDSRELAYRSARELHEQNLWPVLLGDPARRQPPLDPLMIESLAERSGRNPITGDALAPSSATSPLANPINGHEMVLNAQGIDLQYSCIFDLTQPRDCTSTQAYCDCGSRAFGENKPICQNASGGYGSTQFRAKAFPAPRQLEVLKGIGDNAVVASICARNVKDPARSDYGYRSALATILDRLATGLL
jgi:hypothetical protein